MNFVTFTKPELSSTYPVQQTRCSNPNNKLRTLKTNQLQHQLVPISTPLHASIADFPTSAPICTHINTTTCFTCRFPDVSTNLYPYKHHYMLYFSMLTPISTHINTTTCFTCSFPDDNTNCYPYQHHYMLQFQRSRYHHILMKSVSQLRYYWQRTNFSLLRSFNVSLKATFSPHFLVLYLGRFTVSSTHFR
jgi:hypothetical protein